MLDRKFEKAKSWTEEENDILREFYPKGGSQAAASHLPVSRTLDAIKRQAQRLGVKASGYLKYADQADSEFVDAAIRRAVLSGKRGALKKLEQTTNRSRGWLTWRAMRLGLLPERKRTVWTAEEDALLESLSGRTAETIARIFKAKGFARSPRAIYVRLYKKGLDNSDPDTHTASDLARLFGISRNVIDRWLTKGWLKAERGRLSPRPGNPVFWRIRRENVKRFVRDYPGEIDLRKVDSYWFIELLAGPPRRAQADSEKRLAQEDG